MIPNLNIVAQMDCRRVWPTPRNEMRPVAPVDGVPAPYIELSSAISPTALTFRECSAEWQLVEVPDALQSTHCANGHSVDWSVAPRGQRRSDYHWRSVGVAARGFELYRVEVIDGLGRREQPTRGPGAGQYFLGIGARSQRSNTSLMDDFQHIP